MRPDKQERSALRQPTAAGPCGPASVVGLGRATQDSPGWYNSGSPSPPESCRCPLPLPGPAISLKRLLSRLPLAYAVATLSNQNQYLLHGLAAGGHGHLSHDWLANTRDPTPVFSALIAASYRHLGLLVLQATYFLVLVGYFLSVRWLVRALPGLPDTLAFRLMFAALFTAAHAAILRVASVELTGVDYPWYLQCGVANQYILGPGVQPSVFGTLLVAALAAFANGRTLLAGTLAGLTCAFHFTYLLPTAILTVGSSWCWSGPEEREERAFKCCSRSELCGPGGGLRSVHVRSPNPHVRGVTASSPVRLPHRAETTAGFPLPMRCNRVGGTGLVLLLRRSPFASLLIAAAAGIDAPAIQHRRPHIGPHFLGASRRCWSRSRPPCSGERGRLPRRDRLSPRSSYFGFAASGSWLPNWLRTDVSRAELLEYVRTQRGRTTFICFRSASRPSEQAGGPHPRRSRHRRDRTRGRT